MSVQLSHQSEQGTQLQSALKLLSTKVRKAPLCREIGEISDISASRIVTTLRNVFVGEKCLLRTPGTDREIAAQVVAIENERAILAPLEEIEGLAANTEVWGTGEPHRIHVGRSLIGRVIDGLGRPIDRQPFDTEGMDQVKITPPVSDALDRPVIDDIFQTGVKSIDGFNTVGQGQRLAIFGEAGSGKSTLLAMLARHSETDVVVLAMIGERGREVNEFLERQLPPEVRERCVVIASTSDRPAMERIMAAHCAVTVCEHFRSKGQRVLLLFDSVTRYARALREVGLSAGEKAVRAGFTPSVYAELPRLIERTGKTSAGAITAFFTVLTENDGVNDPVAEEIASLTDGHLVLDANLARSGIYPAINVLRSKSRLMNEIAAQDFVESANRLRRLMAKYKDMELLIQVGEYVSGTDPLADQAIEVNAPLEEFLGQHTHLAVPYGDTVHQMQRILNG
ncbi:MAG: FliI/YscN family ATPase [Pseudomonadota bacterium]